MTAPDRPSQGGSAQRGTAGLSSEQRADSLETEGELPPIVARMVVEIRADGTRTIARGALEDLQSGERVALQADASTPFELAAQLSRAIIEIPLLARSLAGQGALDLARKPLEKLRERLGPLSKWGEKTSRLRRRVRASSRSEAPPDDDDGT